MRSLTRSYKKKETALFKLFSARASSAAAKALAAARRRLRGARQGLTVLVLDDSTREPRGITLSYLGLGLGFLGFAAILALTIAFSFGILRGDARAAGSGGELEAARAELDRYRRSAAALSEAYASLSRPLSELSGGARAGAGGNGSSLLASLRASGAAAAARLRGELQGMAEASAGLEAAIGPLEELGKAAASMEAVKPTVPALWPIKSSLGHLSATYGPNPNPFTGDPYFHTGIDCSTYRRGDPIVATADGTIAFSGSYYGYGLCVLISHPNGYFTRYGHMDKLLVRRGQQVKQGQTIGILGNTGHTTGPHVHYEVLIGGKLADPIDYLWSLEDRKAPEGTIPFGME